ncbi:hypothetical protein LIER_40591 [Lithospermum erythrorhizon]|uniref:DUF7792 domain-containing protein n=1 Tax=Lithospermum erythrorhizon TaxID=34254 RepID=A0AAV3QY08_LITER
MIMESAKSTLATIASMFNTTPVEEEGNESLPINEDVTNLIFLAESICKHALLAESCQAECSELATKTSRLCNHLRSVVRFIASAQYIYERPIRRIAKDVTRKLENAVTLVKKCENKKTNILRYVFSITSADFKKVEDSIDASIADIAWLLTVFDSDSGIEPSLLPIATNNPRLVWIWSYISCIHYGNLLYRNDAVKGLNEFLISNDRSKQIVVEENGIPPLLNLLKEKSDPDAQIFSTTALYNLADEQERVCLIVKENGVSIIVSALNESPSHRVQMELARLVSRMVDLDANVKEEFGRKNVIRPLVKLLGIYVVLDEGREFEVANKSANLNSIAGLNEEMTKNGRHGSNLKHGNKEEREEEIESPEEILQLKVNCVNALWKLAKSSLLNSTQIAESKALRYLARSMEKENGELKIHCLSTVMEVAAMAKVYPELRTSFKLNSSASKAVLNQLLRILNEENSASLLVPATKAIGSLARAFSAKETRIIELLVMLLGHMDHNVAKQAVSALTSFVEPDNFNRVDHSKAFLEFHGLPKLLNLLMLDEQNQRHEVILLCFLAVNVGNSKEFNQARAKTVLAGAAPYFSDNSYLRESFIKAINNLALYQAGAPMHTQVYTFMVDT